MTAKRDELTVVWKAAMEEAGEILETVRRGQELANLRTRIDDVAEVLRGRAEQAAARLFDDISVDSPEDTLVLGRRRLLGYLAVRVLEASSIRDVLQGKTGLRGPSAREKLSIVQALCRLVAPLLENAGSLDPSGMEEGKDRVEPEAAIHLLAEIARREYGLPAAIDVEGALLSFAKVEPALFLWRKAYRDHLLHAADVCLLGWLLLDAEVPGGGSGSLASHLAPGAGMSVEALYRNWFLAALVHDVGYAMDAIRQCVKHVAYLKSKPLEDLRIRLEKALKSVDAEIAGTWLSDLGVAGLEGLDHGVVSYLHLWEVLEKAIPDADRRAAFRPACDAVRKHHLPVPIDFKNEPVAALLVLCDELQEWERPRVSGRGLATGARDLAAGAGSPASPSSGEASESLELGGLAPRPGVHAFRFVGTRLKCVLTYGPPELGKFWPQWLCLDKCHNLQRLDPRGFPLRVKMALVHQYLAVSPGREHGLEALRSYALSRPEAGLLDFAEGRREGKTIICFRADPGSVERLSFDLKRLCRNPLLPRRLDVDWEDFAKWMLARLDPYALEPLSLLRDDR